MQTPSQFLSIAFAALVLFVAVIAVRAIMGLSPRLKPSLRLVTALMIGWPCLTGLLAALGVLAKFEAFPPPVMPLILFSVVVSLILSGTRFGTQAIEQWSLEGMVAFQAFRLPLELLMHRAASEGVMPPQMSFSGYNFDILTGLLAILLATGIRSGILGRRAAMLWNLMGAALLINIVIIAVASVPGPLRMFHNQPANIWIGYFPFVWLPTFLVPLAAAGHVLVGRKLLLGELKDSHQGPK